MNVTPVLGEYIVTLQYLVPERRGTDKEALLFLIPSYGTRCH